VRQNKGEPPSAKKSVGHYRPPRSRVTTHSVWKKKGENWGEKPKRGRTFLNNAVKPEGVNLKMGSPPRCAPKPPKCPQIPTLERKPKFPSAI